MDAIDSHRRCLRHNARSGSGDENAAGAGRVRDCDRAWAGDLLRIARTITGRSMLLGAALVMGAARASIAQVSPNADWRTIQTRHFRIHFTPPLEAEARRAAVNAERAYC